jgi:antitoxin component HigA of HigAB toxin-antitoxin module
MEKDCFNPVRIAKLGALACAGRRRLVLVRECPLQSIPAGADDRHQIAALVRSTDYGPERTEDDSEYLLAVAFFGEKDEREHEPIPVATGIEVLRYLLESHALKQGDAAAGTSLTASIVSEILAGERESSVRQIESLAQFFKVVPSVFLDD